jgi:metal-responsive CopG/Arc/MetJ family transcriptional regulator
MSQTIIINLPEAIKDALDDAVREEGKSRNELVEKALKDYLFIRRFRNLREQMLAQSPDAYTDQDVFDQVS